MQFIQMNDGGLTVIFGFGRLLCYQIMLLILANTSLVKKCLHLTLISLAPQASLANKVLQVRYRPEGCECEIVP